MRKLKNILVTGGAGFIGSNFIRHILKQEKCDGRVINADKLTYAGNLGSLIDIEREFGGTRYFFEKADIADCERMKTLLKQYEIDTIVHFAAESHVDRSIHGPSAFIQTNIVGTFALLDAAREVWDGKEGVLFHHVSTDEVYGSLPEQGYFVESTPYDPRSPYSASKASSDHLVSAYHHTYHLPVTISNCSNNYGPYQFPEKLIPLVILNMLDGKNIPVYGDGSNIRDWLYVDDHNSAVWLILNKGVTGETYNIGGENEWKNIELVECICQKMAEIKKVPIETYKKHITFVKDRPGHDRRYAIDCNKIKKELGWRRAYDFGGGIERTITWYLENEAWITSIKSGAYKSWMEKNYKER